MEARGLRDVMMLGIAGDLLPLESFVRFWDMALPDVPWVIHAHATLDRLYDIAPIQCRATVFGSIGWAVDPACERFYGWKRDPLTVLFPRTFKPGNPLPCWRLLPEWNIQGTQNGVGRLPGDYVGIPAREGRSPWRLYRRYGIRWGNAGIGKGLASYIEAGPDGPVPTMQYEMFREGIQECEARIFIENALTDEKLRARLGGNLAARCQALLDERTRFNMWVYNNKITNYNRGWSLIPGDCMPYRWFAGSDWQQRSARLFAAAAEVQARLASGRRTPPSRKRPMTGPEGSAG
jgi:hypothetical protein